MRRLEGKLAVEPVRHTGSGARQRFASLRKALILRCWTLRQTRSNRLRWRLGRRQVLTIVGNCTDEATIVASFKTIYDEFGFIDVLMNNVGQSARERASEFYKSTPDVWRFVIDVTLMSTLLASRQVVPSMRDAGRGKIVNVASNAGMAGEIGISEYAAAKMGVIGFTRSLARELAPFKVNVNAVCPGVTKTRVIDRISDEILDKIRASIPLGFFAEPEDIAAAAAFLASDDARYMTGQSVVVDGGRWMI